MNKFLLSIGFVFAFMFFGYGQPANYGWIANFDNNFNNSRTFVDGAAGSNFRSLTVQATDNSSDYVIEWDFFNNKWQNINSPLNSEFILFHGGSGEPNGNISDGVSNGNYYTFQIEGLAYSNRNAVIMETSNEPINISSLTFDDNVFFGEDVEIAITLSGNKSSEERLFIRYSDDDFATSNLVEVDFDTATSSSGIALIPSTFNTGGKTVEFYAYSTTVNATPTSNHDLISLRIINNSGSNYTYNVREEYITTFGSTNWDSALSWCSGSIPPSDADVIINSDITLNTDATVSSLTINNGATFIATDGTNRTLTISKSTSGNQTTFENNGTWNNGAANSTIVFSGEPNPGDAIHQIRGTSATEFFNIIVNKTGGTNNVGADFENSTVSGTLEIGTGGFISTAPPSGFYTEDAILLFNQGASANFVVNAGGFTWSTSEIPNNITVQSGTVTLADNRNVSNEILINSDAALAINSGNTLSSTGVITNNGTLTINGDLVFRSTADGTGQYGTSTGTITGNVTAERFIPAKRAFRLLSSPVEGQTIASSWQQAIHITGAQGALGEISSGGFDQTGSGAPSMFTFDNTLPDQSGGQAWSPIANTNATNLEIGLPYRVLVRGSRSTVNLADNNSPISDVTLSATGNLVTGSLTTGTELPAMASLAQQFSFIGNPYQSVVDVTELNFTGDLNMNYIYVWDPRIAGENGNGGYVVVDLISGTGSPNPSTSQASEFIMPGQAFFIRNNETLTTAPTLTFTESAKAVLTPQTEVFSTNTEAFLNLQLYSEQSWNANDFESDALGIRWSLNYTTPFSDEDSGKLGNAGENIAVHNGNMMVGIDKRQLPEEEEVIPLFVNNYQHENYVFKPQFDNLPSDWKLYLEDQYLQTLSLLDNDEVYHFSVDASIAESVATDRFSLHFQPVTLNNSEFSKNDFSIYPNPVQDVLHINWKAIPNGDTKIFIFNLVGKRIASFHQDASDDVQTISVQSLEAGVYLLQIQNEDINVTKKFIKR